MLDAIEVGTDFDDEATVLDVGRGDTLAGDTYAAGIEPNTMVGEYRVIRKIAEGGMAEIFEGEHPVIGKRVAIKVLSAAQCGEPGGVERFLQEARAVNKIAHPHIVDVFSLGTLEDGRSYMVMEWLPGRTLARRIAGGPMPIDDVIEIMDQLADALQAAHAARIAHRDLKPDNVFLVEAPNGQRSAKLLDFGIAKLLDGTAARHTRDGMCVGTPGYMSPEQARGLTVDARTDIYSLGVLAFEMVTGHLPFRGASGMDIMVKQLSTEPMPPSVHRPGIPASLNGLIRRMIEREVEYRPSLAEVRTTLAKLQAASVRGNTLALSHVPSPAPLPVMPRFMAVGTQPQTTQPAQPCVSFRQQTTESSRIVADERRAATETTFVGAIERPAWKRALTIGILLVMLAVFAALMTSAIKRKLVARHGESAPVSLLERRPGGEPVLERSKDAKPPLLERAPVVEPLIE